MVFFFYFYSITNWSEKSLIKASIYCSHLKVLLKDLTHLTVITSIMNEMKCSLHTIKLVKAVIKTNSWCETATATQNSHQLSWEIQCQTFFSKYIFVNWNRILFINAMSGWTIISTDWVEHFLYPLEYSSLQNW